MMSFAPNRRPARLLRVSPVPNMSYKYLDSFEELYREENFNARELWHNVNSRKGADEANFLQPQLRVLCPPRFRKETGAYR